MRISDWSSDVCSSDLTTSGAARVTANSSGRSRLNTPPPEPQAERPRAMAQRPKPATNLRISFLHFGPLVAQQERARKQDQHTYGNGRISKIEDKKRPPFADVKIGKIHHIAKENTIKDIAKKSDEPTSELQSLMQNS